MPEYKNQLISFKNNVPVHVTLATDPKTAKTNTKDTQWGPKVSHTIFCEDNKVMFASEALHGHLMEFNRGDSVVITKVYKDGKNYWTVNAAGSQPQQPVKSENNPALQQIMVLLQEIKDIVSQKNGKEHTKEDEDPNF